MQADAVRFVRLDAAAVAAQYDATELMNGVTEVLAYGTAVVVERNAA